MSRSWKGFYGLVIYAKELPILVHAMQLFEKTQKITHKFIKI